MDDAELIRLNALGLIPGPDEDEAKFLERSHFCLGLKNLVLEGKLPEDRKEALDEVVQPALALTQSLFGVSPTFVPVFFSNWRLMPWHGASAWIFQLQEEGPLGAVIQLRKGLYSQKQYLGLYNRDEIIAHEYAHVARMAFEEPKYEELFASRTSKRGISRWIGPILQSSFESRLFVYTLVGLLLFDLYFAFTESWQLYLSFLPLKAIPILMALYGGIRLWYRKKKLKEAEKRLASITGPEKAPHVLFRLTDREIEFFAVASLEESKFYINQESSLRWQAIRGIMPKNFPEASAI